MCIPHLRRRFRIQTGESGKILNITIFTTSHIDNSVYADYPVEVRAVGVGELEIKLTSPARAWRIHRMQ
jgi:hypothetical protein